LADAGPLAAWSGAGFSSGPYTITLTGATFIGEAPCLDDAGGYDDDPGDGGFVFEAPFDDAGQTDQPNPSPTGADPTLAGVLAGATDGASGQPNPDGAVSDTATPAVGPERIDELPRTGLGLLPMGVAAGLFLAGRALSALGRRRRTGTA
jgi:hypothetical protein